MGDQRRGPRVPGTPPGAHLAPVRHDLQPASGRSGADRRRWARYFQRHLLQAADETYYSSQDKWSVHDDAKRFRAQVVPLLRGLTLCPLCLEHLGRPGRAQFLPRTADFLNQHLERMGDHA